MGHFGKMAIGIAFRIVVADVVLMCWKAVKRKVAGNGSMGQFNYDKRRYNSKAYRRRSDCDKCSECGRFKSALVGERFHICHETDES